MARVLRGEIYWADLDPALGSEQGGHRPVLVISHDILNMNSGTVIAMAITSQKPKAGFPLSMAIESCVLPKPSWVKMNQIRTLSDKRLGSKLGRISDEELQKIISGLYELVD